MDLAVALGYRKGWESYSSEGGGRQGPCLEATDLSIASPASRNKAPPAIVSGLLHLSPFPPARCLHLHVRLNSLSSPLSQLMPPPPTVQQVMESHILKLFQSSLGPADPE